jgi:predicted O-methyltransferase YrrM
MSPKTIGLDDELYQYLVSVGVRDTPVLRELRAETATLSGGHMQIAPDQGQFMGLLVELTGARRILEFGTFTGYSTLCMALALPPEGAIDACDIDPDTTAVGRRYWDQAGVGDRVHLHIGAGAETADRFIAEGRVGTYDLAFVDADKENYDRYFEQCLELVRPGGLILFDNVLWGGSVVNPDKRDAATEALRALNEKIHDDPRVSIALVPIGDGLTMARKR